MGDPQSIQGLTRILRSHQYYYPQLATLDLPDFPRLTNDTIQHAPHWKPIPNKLPSDILKFDGKLGEDPKNHVMTFHCWCSSNSLMDHSIHLCLSQRTFTGMKSRWYIEFSSHFFIDYGPLAMAFFTHF